MAEDRAVVRNAADPEQVRRAKRKVRAAEREAENDVRVALSTYEARRREWKRIGKWAPYESIWSSDVSRMAFNAGVQNCAHELIAEIVDADPELWLLMQREAMDRKRELTEPEANTETQENSDA